MSDCRWKTFPDCPSRVQLKRHSVGQVDPLSVERALLRTLVFLSKRERAGERTFHHCHLN